MQRKDVKIGIISDSRNQAFADTYLDLLKAGSYAACNCRAIYFDTAHPHQLGDAITQPQLLLAQVGLPGRGDYQKTVYSFLEIYASVARKPVVGLITHDSDHTRYVIENWLLDNTNAYDTLPDGAVNIIDASRPLRPKTLEKALDILMDKRNVVQISKSLLPPLHVQHRQTAGKR